MREGTEEKEKKKKKLMKINYGTIFLQHIPRKVKVLQGARLSRVGTQGLTNLVDTLRRQGTVAERQLVNALRNFGNRPSQMIRPCKKKDKNYNQN